MTDASSPVRSPAGFYVGLGILVLLLVGGWAAWMPLRAWYFRNFVFIGDRHKDDIVIGASAAGWDVKRGAKDASGAVTTIIVDPSGREHSIGLTQYPDAQTALAWKIRVPRLNACFLVLYVPPASSGAAVLTLIRAEAGAEPVRAADIRHRYEFGFLAGQESEVRVGFPDHPKGRLLRSILFADCDDDGTPELKENDIGKWGGTVRYYKYGGKRFIPCLEEHYAPDSSGRIVLVRKRSLPQ
jgi:hypothetical protein